MPAESAVYAFGPYLLDRTKRLLLRDGESVGLTPKAFDLLAVLAANGGSIVSKETLMSQLWPDTAVEEGNLAFQVSTLRKALGDGRYIVTIPGRGYQLAGPVQSVGSEIAETIIRDEERTTITVSEEQASTAKWMAIVVATLVVAIAVIAFIALRRPARSTSTATSIRSIAVLPFKPIAGARRDEALELGMADTLITRLSRLSNLVVSPTSAVRRFDKLDQDPIAAGRELGVDSVVDASIQRGADRVRVTVRLLRVSDGRALWAEQFDEQWPDLFGVEDRVADGVARSIVPPLSGRDRQLLTKRTTADLEAYDLYLKGVYWNERDTNRAEEFFNRAIARDPRFAAAWAGVATANLRRGRFANKPPDALYERARQAAAKAIALDPDLAEAHASLAEIYSDHDWRWDLADEEFRRAIELDASSIEAHSGYAYMLALRRDLDAALLHARRARELDPLSPTANVSVGLCLEFAGKKDEAVRSLQETLRLYPDLVPARLHLAITLAEFGQPEEGAEIARDILRTRPGSPHLLGVLAYALAKGGHRDEALRITRELESKESNAGGQEIVLPWVALGDFDRAFYWLDRACDGHTPLVRSTNAEPAFAPLWSDPRFAAIRKRMGLQ